MQQLVSLDIDPEKTRMRWRVHAGQELVQPSDPHFELSRLLRPREVAGLLPGDRVLGRQLTANAAYWPKMRRTGRHGVADTLSATRVESAPGHRRAMGWELR